MKTLFAKKDTKCLCPHCGEHIFTFNKDVFVGDLMKSEDLYKDQGQGPFSPYQRFVCLKCKKDFNPNDLKKVI